VGRGRHPPPIQQQGDVFFYSVWRTEAFIRVARRVGRDAPPPPPPGVQLPASSCTQGVFVRVFSSMRRPGKRRSGLVPRLVLKVLGSNPAFP
jgi:hypothetical protein